MIIETICNNPESRDMVLQAIGTIDVLCMSDAEHRDICVNEGAEECVKVVMDTYESDLEIVDACKSTLLSINFWAHTEGISLLISMSKALSKCFSKPYKKGMVLRYETAEMRMGFKEIFFQK